jgi:hypothetical protein
MLRKEKKNPARVFKRKEGGVILISFCVELAFVMTGIFFLYNLSRYYLVKFQADAMIRAVTLAYRDECSYIPDAATTGSTSDLDVCIQKIKTDLAAAAQSYVGDPGVGVYIRVYEEGTGTSIIAESGGTTNLIPKPILTPLLLPAPKLDTVKNRSAEFYLSCPINIVAVSTLLGIDSVTVVASQ